jgi:hypothetical protein
MKQLITLDFSLSAATVGHDFESQITYTIIVTKIYRFSAKP